VALVVGNLGQRRARAHPVGGTHDGSD
jgi:hypothetical protein